MNENLITTGTYRPLKKRGIAVDTCRKYGYQTDYLFEEPVHIENVIKDGATIAQHIRKPDKSFFWRGVTKKLPLFGQHLFRTSGGKQLIITEGAIDCMSIAQALGLSWQVVSLTNGTGGAVQDIKNNIEFISSYQNVILAFDDDGPGREAIDKCGMLLPPGRVKVMSYGGHKDANDLFIEGGSKAIVKQVFEAADYRPDGIASETELIQALMEKPEEGIPFLYPTLSAKLGGLRRKRLYLITAGSGLGKSTMVHEIAHDIQNTTGDPIGVLALEESLRETQFRHISIATNGKVNDGQTIDEADMVGHYHEHISGKYFFYNHFGSKDIDSLLSRIRFLIHSCGCRWIILDHVSIVVSGLRDSQDERKTIDLLMTELRSLVEETGVSILGISHLSRTDSKRKDWTQGEIPKLADLRGSGALEHLSDVVIGASRNQDDEECWDVATLHVLKNRPNHGKVGPCDDLQYNEFTRRLLPVDNTKEERDTNNDDSPF